MTPRRTCGGCEHHNSDGAPMCCAPIPPWVPVNNEAWKVPAESAMAARCPLYAPRSAKDGEM